MKFSLDQVTLLVGVDAAHLEELRWTWPSWVRFKPEILQMPALVFYDRDQVEPRELEFLHEHPNLRTVPWEMPAAESQRERMLTGFIEVPATEVRTPWYLKLDTDVLATQSGPWIEEEWFQPDAAGRLPVFVAARWGYSKPRYVIDLLDDWADGKPDLAAYPRLNLPYSSNANCVKHRRIISWIFFGRTEWTAQTRQWLGGSGRLPYPSQDTFLFYCARRLRCHYRRIRMSDHGWSHMSLPRIRERARALGISKAASEHSRSRGFPAPVGTGPRAEQGVVYYNTNTSCAVRLLVSLFSLRQHYAGPVVILSEGEASHALCRPIALAMGAEFREWNCGVPAGEHRPYLAKTRLHEGSPFQVTIALDSDTLVLGPIDPLFDEADDAGFCVAQLGKWRSNGSTIARRIRRWSAWLPDDIERALQFGPAINCGVLAFRRDSLIFRDWLSAALPGRDTFIPDEVCCQVILHRYPHRILDERWNYSCKHGTPDAPEKRIIHYHGRKHCRPGLPYYGELWVSKFEEVYKINLAGVQQWQPASDRMLARHIRNSGIQD